MKPTQLFLESDRTLRTVINHITPDELDTAAPPEWSERTQSPTLRDILFAHIYDEVWVPDVLAGSSVADGDPYADADLLGNDPVASYNAANDAATAAVAAGVDTDRVVHFTYGDYSAGEGLVHMAMYRAFQAWSISHLLGRPIELPSTVLDGLEEHVVPHIDEWRQYGVFPPATEPPADADRQTRLLCATGYWQQ